MARCNFWDCEDTVDRVGDGCVLHEPLYRAGLLDACDDCGMLKNLNEELCGNCSRWDSFSGSAYEDLELDLVYDFDLDDDEGLEASFSESGRYDSED